MTAPSPRRIWPDARPLPTRAREASALEASEAEAWPGPDVPAPLDFHELVEILYRRWPTIAKTAAAVAAAALIYLALAPSRYTAEFLILVDPQRARAPSGDTASTADRAMDPGLVDSQVEILKSDGVLLRVARKLDLIDDPDLMLPHGLVGWTLSDLGTAARSWLPGRGRPETRDDRERAIVERLGEEIRVKRMGLTYVIQVQYRGYDPDKAATIANAIADAYVVGEWEARYDAARRAGDWLRDRIREMGEQASGADLAVQKYKSEHDIVDTSRGLIMEQRLADVNSQLVNASAATAEAKARLDRILEVAESPIGNAAVADALHSDVISRLRAEYLDLDSKEADYALRFGKDHASVRNIHGQKVQIQVAAREELARVAESTRSDYAIALAREQSLKTSLDALIAAASQNNGALGALRNLESVAQSYRDLYETMLRKAEETTRQQLFPVAGDRVITSATPPRQPSWPKPVIVIPAAALLGLALGCALALSRELLGDTFRSARDVTSHAGLPCLGILPAVELSRGRAAGASLALARPALLGYAVAAPFSRFSGIVRNVKASVDLRRRDGEAAVIGIVSSLANEGKTTFGANLASLCARMGGGTILIDGDLDRRALSNQIAPGAEDGLIELLEGTATLEQAIQPDAATRLDFIPCVAKGRDPNATAILASAEMARLLVELRSRYDYIVVDLPAIVAAADVKASADMIDQFVVVVEWGRTSRDAVRDALILAAEVRRRAIGIVLNKAEPGALRRIEAHANRRAS
jgi:succinoglycan biosynthesis transport protein ExoP